MFRMGIDVGGTNIAAGIFNGRDIIGAGSVPTEVGRGRDAVCKNIRRAARQAAERAGIGFDKIGSIGVGFPGSADPRTRPVYSSSNLKCMDGVNIREIFADMPDGVRLFLDNDANAAAWGEYLFCGGGNKNLTMITVGTGIGCGIVADGGIYRGFNGLAGEAGHMVVQKGGRPCGCGRRGCLERYASMSGLILTAESLMKGEHGSRLWSLCDGDLTRLDGKMIFDACEDGDRTAAAAVQSFIEYLAEGISNVIMLLQPEVIALSGAVMRRGQMIIEPLRRICEKNMYRTKNGYTKIRAAECADAGLFGAAMLEKTTARFN